MIGCVERLRAWDFPVGRWLVTALGFKGRGLGVPSLVRGLRSHMALNARAPPPKKNKVRWLFCFLYVFTVLAALGCHLWGRTQLDTTEAT